MIGFLSTTNDPKRKVKAKDIFFVHIPDGSNLEAIKRLIAPTAKSYAEKVNLDKVFLHFGKEIIIYDIKV